MTKEEKVLLELGKRIKAKREKKNLSQLRLAYKCEVAKSYISELENGKRNPTVKTLIKIADTLGVTLGELFKDRDPFDF